MLIHNAIGSIAEIALHSDAWVCSQFLFLLGKLPFLWCGCAKFLSHSTEAVHPEKSYSFCGVFFCLVIKKKEKKKGLDIICFCNW